MKYKLISLGCPKNLVDAEVMLGVLAQQGYEITTDEKAADVIIVNTCSFIKEAREESVDAILDLADRKSDGNCKTLIVAGCLPQRYQEELAILVQRLNDARRQARRALEAGRASELPQLAQALAPAFAGTPFTALQRQFSVICTEAAGVAALWNTDWRTTAIAFERQRGERAIAAGAAMLLAGDPSRARRILLADPQLAEGAFMRRREALMGGLAAVLTFDEPADMQYLDVAVGEPRLEGGALVGRAAQAVGLAAGVPVGGSDWLAEVALRLDGADAEVVLSCVAGGEPALLVRLAEGRLVVRHAGAERSVPATVAGQRRLRLTCRGGALLVVLDGREQARFERSAVPAEAQLRLDLAGADWRLEEMQVVGGR